MGIHSKTQIVPIFDVIEEIQKALMEADGDFVEKIYEEVVGPIDYIGDGLFEKSNNDSIR